MGEETLISNDALMEQAIVYKEPAQL